MVNEEAKRIVIERKLRRLIRTSNVLLLRIPRNLVDYHEVSELKIQKIKFQLMLNSLLAEEAKGDGEKKKLEDERKALQASLADELKNGVGLIDWLKESMRQRGMNDRAEELEILRDVRESELEELTG
ncbi:MAG: hypothetical protein NT130_03700 [Candidatus Micrarchaeota archaeon]|nr:hypothetical protein [Candidatus Micrarchaeota archaeon]